MEAGAVVALVTGTVVVLSVPALVWSTAIARLHKNVQTKIGHSFRAVAARLVMSTR